MKFYTSQQFIKDGFTIPNLKAGYTLTKDTFNDDYGRQKNFWKITYNGTFLIEFYMGYSNSFEIPDLDREQIIETGTNVGLAMNKRQVLSCLLDDLYYESNPPKFATTAGRIFQKTFDAFYNRSIQNSALTKTKLTVKLTECIDSYITDKAQREHPEVQPDTQEFYRLKQLSYRVIGGVFSLISGKLCMRDSIVYINGVESVVGYEERAEDFGLVLHTVHYRTYWIRPDQYVHNSMVFNRDEGSVECPHCSRTVPASYMSTEEGVCQDCINNQHQIHNYSVRVPQLLKFKAKKVKPDTLYLGCELEYETTNRESARVKVGKALKGHAIMKSDGSIRNGFEVVTCPATLDIHLEVFKTFFDNRPSELTIASNVGMHVHVSRKPLSVLTVGKLTEFMNRTDNAKFITHVAGRAPNTYCRQAARELSYPLTSSDGGERYNALNLCNRETIEFRIFSTPLTYEDFASKIQFCQALVEYSKPCSQVVALKVQTSFKNFINWVLPQRKAYPELVAKLKSFSQE
jgi:hypothetical protein